MNKSKSSTVTSSLAKDYSGLRKNLQTCKPGFREKPKTILNIGSEQQLISLPARPQREIEINDQTDYADPRPASKELEDGVV